MIFQKTIAGFLLTATLAPSLFIPTVLYAQTVVDPNQSGTVHLGGGGSFDFTTSQVGGADPLGIGETQTKLDVTGVNTPNSNDALSGFGQGVGSAVGNIGACAAAGFAGIGAALGIASFLGLGAAAAAGAQIYGASVLQVQDRGVYYLLGGDLSANAATAVTTQTQTIVECFLNGLVVLVREVLIAQLTASIVNWINGGFNGNPSFVQDPGQFLRDVADQTIGEFIGGVGLSFVCSPFQLQLKRALSFSYGTTRRNACTLSQVVRNFEGFINGGFESDGWAGWFAMANNPSNTLLGSYLHADAELSLRIVNAQGQEIKLLDWGQGFLSYKDPKTGKIVTPGSVVVDQLNKTLFNGHERLAMASQINQIVGALVNQAMNHVFGSGGLLGQSKSNYGSQSPVAQAVTVAQKENLRGQQNLLIGTLQGASQSVQTMASVAADGLSRVGKSKGILTSTQACYRSKINTASLSTDQKVLAESRIAEASTTITANIEPNEKKFTAKVTDMLNARSYLANLITQVTADNSGLATEQVNRQYNNLLAGNFVPSNQDISDVRFEIDGVKTSLDQLDISSQQKLDACKAFPGTQT